MLNTPLQTHAVASKPSFPISFKGRWVFFGTSQFAVHALERLKAHGMIPGHIVTTPDKPKGRKLVLTPSPVKVWAEANHIPYHQFEKLDAEAAETLGRVFIHDNTIHKPDLFIVASYGKIIPQRVLDIPEYGTLNVHPSKLPELRGASPLQSTITLDKSKTAVAIIQMDSKMDHGPIVAIEPIDFAAAPYAAGFWPPAFSELERITADIGADLIAEHLGWYIQHAKDGSSAFLEQRHDAATFTQKITKADGQIDPLNPDLSIQREAYLKVKAYEGWPGTYFFIQKQGQPMRVLVKDASWSDEGIRLLKVTPEGGKDMTWESFQQSLADSKA